MVRIFWFNLILSGETEEQKLMLMGVVIHACDLNGPAK